MTTQFVEGLALVASPYLGDRNFLRAVVYVAKHDSEGAYGLILNRPTDISVSQLLSQVLGDDIGDVRDHGNTIFHGGPVEGPVVIVHEQAGTESSLYAPGVYLSSDQDDFAALCQQTLYRYRVFCGYAGWAPQQLDQELKQGGWLVWEITKDDIFGDPNELWQTAIRQIGREILTEGITGDRIPNDPSCN